VREGGPIFLGWPHAINDAAWLLEIGVLGALLERERSGAGQVVTSSLLDCVAILSNPRWLGRAKLGSSLYAGSRIATRASNMRIVVHLFECNNGNWSRSYGAAHHGRSRSPLESQYGPGVYRSWLESNLVIPLPMFFVYFVYGSVQVERKRGVGYASLATLNKYKHYFD
jgi:hypothetical protein